MLVCRPHPNNLSATASNEPSFCRAERTGGPRRPFRKEQAKWTPAGVQSFDVTDRTHVDGPVAFAQVPPVAGNHAAIWQTCGFSDAPVVNENGVHSLEQGAVWITDRPDLPVVQVEALRRLTQGQTHVLVSPYPDLPAPVVASAWDRQLRLDSAQEPRLAQVVRVFQRGSQAPEAGAPCTGGVGQPV